MWPLGFPLTSQMDSVHSLPLHSPPAWSYSSPASVNGAPHPHCMVRAVGSRAAQKDGALPQGGRDPPLKAPHWSLTLLLSLCPLQFLALKVGNSTDFLSKFSFSLVALGLRCCAGFSPAVESGATLQLQCTAFSLQWLLLCSTGCRALRLQYSWLLGSRA